MFVDKFRLPRSLGYKFENYDDNGNEIYAKDGLKWISSYADLADELQQNQNEELSFDDFEYKYGYNIDDYFFYNYQNKQPSEVTVERQKKWIKRDLVHFINCCHQNVNNTILDGKNYKWYEIVQNQKIPYIFLVYESNNERKIYEELINKPDDLIQSVSNSLKAGYEWHVVQSRHEYRPFMYQKNTSSRWIHFIDRLANKLSLNSIVDIEKHGYNVNDYYKFNHDGANDKFFKQWQFRERVTLELHSKIIDSSLLKCETPTWLEVENLVDEILLKEYRGLEVGDTRKKQIIHKLLESKYSKIFPLEKYRSYVMIEGVEEAYKKYLQDLESQ